MKAQTGIIRLGIRLSAMQSLANKLMDLRAPPIAGHFLLWADPPPALEKESPASNSALFYFHTCQEIHTFYSVPAQTQSATDNSVQRLLLSVSSMTLVPLSHLTFCVDIRSCAKDEGEPFVISEFHCNLFDPIRPEHSNSHHRLPSQQQRPPAH